jgi:hypothetical protein
MGSISSESGLSLEHQRYRSLRFNENRYSGSFYCIYRPEGSGTLSMRIWLLYSVSCTEMGNR